MAERKILIGIGDADATHCNHCPLLLVGAFHARCEAIIVLENGVVRYWNLGPCADRTQAKRHKKCIAAERVAGGRG